jgi:hypothetical protein
MRDLRSDALAFGAVCGNCRGYSCSYLPIIRIVNEPKENPAKKTRQPELSAFLIGRLGLSRDAVPGKSRSSG